MHTLPPLIATSGTFRLPLVDGTAERLVGALLEPQLERRREAFRLSLARDPALAVWALVHARDQPEHVTAYLSGLAGWLAAAPLELFSGITLAFAESEQEALREEFAEPAGCSLAVAELAAQLARAARGNEDRAYLLGIVHLGTAWLQEVSDVDAPHRVSDILPAWLLRDSVQLSQSRAEQSIEAACVAQAMSAICSHERDTWRALDCDSSYWIGRWERLGSEWASSGPWAARLAMLVEQLTVKERLEADFHRTLENAKLEAIKEFAYGAGHEINNPLANISARAQTLLSEETDPERRRTLAAINAQAFRAHEMIADMMLFARPPQPKLLQVELGTLVRTVGVELTAQATDQQTELAVRLPHTLVTIDADPTQIAVALRSICVNSLEALVRGGNVSIELIAPTGEEPRARLRVSDNGPGIPCEVREKIFEPYYSGREAGRGLGLGLSKCWRIVTMHGGAIDVTDADCSSDKPSGAVFTIYLPVSRPTRLK